MLSLYLAANNPSNLVTSSTPPPPTRLLGVPPAPDQTAPGARSKTAEERLPRPQFILPMFFPACHGSLCTFSASQRKTCCRIVVLRRHPGEGPGPGVTSQGGRCSEECFSRITCCRNGRDESLIQEEEERVDSGDYKQHGGGQKYIHGLVLISDLSPTFFCSTPLSSNHLLLFSVFVFYF